MKIEEIKNEYKIKFYILRQTPFIDVKYLDTTYLFSYQTSSFQLRNSNKTSNRED